MECLNEYALDSANVKIGHTCQVHLPTLQLLRTAVQHTKCTCMYVYAHINAHNVVQVSLPQIPYNADAMIIGRL